MKHVVMSAVVWLFLHSIQEAFGRDKFLGNDGKFTATLTLKDSQNGFTGITGLLWIIKTDGSWGRKRFTNNRMGSADQQGKLTLKQMRFLADVLTHAQIHKLPAKIGKYRGPNPHIVALTWGKHECVWTLPSGSPIPKYPDQPFGKLTPEDGFAQISQALRKMLKIPENK
tara:strand:- start:585 stop:1094 length:510 start_codon:yes stop_codon:yes gene_type:complete